MSARILIIEDNEQNLYLTTFLLEKQGLRIVQARDGKEGLSKAVETRPDLILLDIQLPVMDGYEVARRLCAQPETRDTPIVAVTSYAMPGDRERAIEAGCVGYVEKPVNPETFVSDVTKHLPSAPKQGGEL